MISTHQKLSRKIGHRRILVKNMLTSLFLYEKITSTSAKIKAVKPLSEMILNRVKISKNNIFLRRYLKKYLIGNNVINKLIDVYQPNLQNNNKFVFKYKLDTRKGDGAEISMLKINPELLEVIKIDNADKIKTKKLVTKISKSKDK